MTVQQLISMLQRDANGEAKVLISDWNEQYREPGECNCIRVGKDSVVLDVDPTLKEGVKLEKHISSSS